MGGPEPVLTESRHCYDGLNVVELASSVLSFAHSSHALQTVTRQISTNTGAACEQVLGGPSGLEAYHTSVLVNGEEFFFDSGGIESSKNLASHSAVPPRDTGPSLARIVIGKSKHSGSELRAALAVYFEAGNVIEAALARNKKMPVIAAQRRCQ